MKYKVASDGLPILDQFSEDGFVDCILQIVKRSEHGDHIELVLRASHKGKEVGIRALVSRGIRGGFDPDMNLIPEHVYHSGVQFQRSGPESDALVAAIAELYELSGPDLAMVESVAFTGIALHKEGEVDMETQPIKIKLFAYDREEDPSDRYFESFFNLDLANGFVFWNEKDQEYRRPLLQGLSINGGN